MLPKDNSSKKIHKVSKNKLNIKSIEKDKKTSISQQQLEYEEFVNRYINKEFSEYRICDLEKIHEIGKELLNQYFITGEYRSEADILAQLQYIIGETTYNLNVKQASELNADNKKLNEKLQDSIGEIEHIKNDIKSMTTTIISIVLAISIIPTAITGIEKISPNYILPFLTSIIVFGIIMIIFVYSIYQDKIKTSTKVILGITIAMCLLFWGISFNIDLNPREDLTNSPEDILMIDIEEKTSE